MSHSYIRFKNPQDTIQIGLNNNIIEKKVENKTRNFLFYTNTQTNTFVILSVIVLLLIISAIVLTNKSRNKKKNKDPQSN